MTWIGLNILKTVDSRRLEPSREIEKKFELLGSSKQIAGHKQIRKWMWGKFKYMHTSLQGSKRYGMIDILKKELSNKA